MSDNGKMSGNQKEEVRTADIKLKCTNLSGD
jgi:hypothetical protein